jgi:hypothetical protein
MPSFQKVVLTLLIASVSPLLFPATLVAQNPNAQPIQPVSDSHSPKPNLWIAKFSADSKAAAAVASTQAADASALNYSNLFNTVKTFETDAAQPAGTWCLAAKEVDYTGGSAAARALVGWGAGRAHITMEYTLTNPDGKAVWTGKITTKPSFWGASGALGAVQNQRQAMDEQGQKLTDALSKYLNPDQSNSKK